MGKLKVYDNKDDIPEALVEFYEQGDDGKWRPGGWTPKERVDEFRSNNLTLTQQLREMEEKLQKYDLTPEEVKNLRAKMSDIEERQQKQKDKQLLDEGKIDELVEQRVRRLREDLEHQVEELKKHRTAAEQKASELESKYKEERLNHVLADRALSNRIRKKALNLVLNQARQVFDLDDKGEPIALDERGRPIYSKKDGTTPLSPDEYFATLEEEIPWVFEGNDGGGASGGSGGGARGRKINPSDLEGLSANMEAIAAGEVDVGE